MKIKKNLFLVSIIFGVFLISFISAECCLETKSGAICQDLTGTGKLNCMTGKLLAMDCKDAKADNQCKIGTCIDEKHKICSASAPEYKCNKDGGKFEGSPIDSIPKCKTGCCSSPDQSKKNFVIRMQCDTSLGWTFDEKISKENCRVYTEDMGACVLKDKSCKFTTEINCKTILGGSFHEKFLCSNPELNTLCTIPKTTGSIRTECFNGRVYFLDNCGNRANVYNSNKWNDETYWKSVQSSDCSTNGDDVLTKTCGNCKDKESICVPATNPRPEFGDYICRNLNCKDEETGKTRLNGESWCVYESYTGEGKDVVGSAHWRKYCDKGVIKTESCSDYREDICAEEIITKDAQTFSKAICRPNEGWKCSKAVMKDYKFDAWGYKITDETDEKNKQICESISPDCMVKSVDFYYGHDINEGMCRDGWADGTRWDYDQYKPVDVHKYDVCVPKYPIGSRFWDEKSNPEGTCGIMNSLKCVTYWEFDGTAWWCKGNCECLNPEYHATTNIPLEIVQGMFLGGPLYTGGSSSLPDPEGELQIRPDSKEQFIEQMNEICSSLGDCGGKANVVGVYTKNFQSYDVDKLESLDWGNIKAGTDKYYTKQDIAPGDTCGRRTFTLDNVDIEQDKKDDFKSYANKGGKAPTIFASVRGEMSEPLKGSTQGGKNFNNRNATKVEVVFTCQPWQAPSGGSDCEKCNENPLIPCTEYKCKSLGANCEIQIENEGFESEKKICKEKIVSDREPPIISFDINSLNKDYVVQSSTNGVIIKKKSGGCIQEYSPINFVLNTKDKKGKYESARCVYNLKKDAEDIEDGLLKGDSFKEENVPSTIHTFDKYLPSANSEYVSENGELNMYVRCMDIFENPSDIYTISLCIEERPDTESPIIEEYIPKSGSILGSQITEKEITIRLNEPATCKWSSTSNKLYEDMENIFDYCDDNINDIKLNWECKTGLTELTKGKNEIYIRCNDTLGNVNLVDFQYVLSVSEKDLIITSISPQGEIVGGTSNTTKVELKAVTSEGANKGNARCKYEFKTAPEELGGGEFALTGTTSHRQTFTYLTAGKYAIEITCEDSVGNIAKATAEFSLVKDEDAPKVIRVYKDKTLLKFITNEPAKCYYDKNNCTFILDNKIGTEYEITKTLSNVHTTSWKSGITYHVKCIDSFGNFNENCAINIIPGS